MNTWQDKYQLVGDRVADQSGTLVDIGARDRVLQAKLPKQIRYLSADLFPGHDLCWNLEQAIDAPAQAFDFVVVLDVLEHVENIHQAYRELIRITRDRLFISLPNMTCLAFRLEFLRRGRLNGKYDLLANHQGDRHRWLTDYKQSCAFIEQIARESDCSVKTWNILGGFEGSLGLVSRLPFMPAHLRTATIFFEISRRKSARAAA